MLDLLRGLAWQTHLPGLIRLLSTFTLLILSLVYHFQVRGDLQIAQNNNQIQLALIEDARQSRELLYQNMGPYRSLERQGLIGDARRLQWIETLRQLADSLQLTNLRFTLEGSRLVEQDEDPYWRPDVAMSLTRMKLEMQLAHEGDLYYLMNELRDEAPGVFSVESCKIDWQTSENLSSNLARLTGVCELNWYTMVDVTETWPRDPV